MNERKLHPNVIPYWRMERLLQLTKRLAMLSIPVVVQRIWFEASDWITYIAAAFMLLYAVRDLTYMLVGVRYRYDRRSYRLSDDEIMIRWGSAMSDRSSIVPLIRVQHVDKEQDLIARRLGITELAITTAGDDHYIQGLTDDEAETLRRQIVERSKAGDTHAYGGE